MKKGKNDVTRVKAITFKPFAKLLKIVGRGGGEGGDSSRVIGRNRWWDDLMSRIDWERVSGYGEKMQ